MMGSEVNKERLKVLILASDCHPSMPSLPVVGYKYACAISEFADVTVVTHIRNKDAIRKIRPTHLDSKNLSFDFIDVRYIAKPIRKISTFLRGGNEVAWSIGMMSAYPSQVEFERQIWKKYKSLLKGGAYDVIHRITPMSPTMPSYMAGRSKQPFVVGPLNGNLDWPKEFSEEQKREKETARKLRNLYKILPFSKRTFKKSDSILAAFQHTVDDLPSFAMDKVVMFPEVGYDDTIFHAEKRRIPKQGAPMHFLFAGRLVPYKLPEVAIRAFVESEKLRNNHFLHIVGDGPEMSRLKHLVETNNAQDRVFFEGRLTQAEVAQKMRETDVFVFPSIRELGAGVVVEAMACGMISIVVDYGGPAGLIQSDRGVKVPLADREALVASFRKEMEELADHSGSSEQIEKSRNAIEHAKNKYLWSRKSEMTIELYEYLLDSRKPKPQFFD